MPRLRAARVLVVGSVVVAATAGFVLGSTAVEEGSSAPVGGAGSGAEVVVAYPDVPEPWRAWQDEVRDSGVLEDAAEDLRSVVALPRRLTIEVTSCKDGTGYLQGEAVVELCLQDVEASRDELVDADADGVDETLRGIWRETFFHEAGHAVIDLLDLPFTGREEDVADQFAAWRLAEPADAESSAALVSSAFEYEVLAATYEAEPDDEHSSDAARAVNYLCYLYGSDPDTWEDLVDDAPLTQDRADLCEDEWDRLRVGWRTLLDDVDALRG